MNRGGLRTQFEGFTIVETLIVLAVTSVLFVSTMLLISGRQARTEFQVGAQAIGRNTQSLVSQIESGRYTNPRNFSCNASAAGPVFTGAPGSTQGSSGDCIFLGQSLFFGRTTTDFDTYLLAGLRSRSGAEVTSLTSSVPKTDVSTKQTIAFPRGLTYVGARFGTTGTIYNPGQVVGVRLMVDLSSTGVSGDTASSQQVSVHATNATIVTNDVTKTNSASPIEQKQQSFSFCLAGGSNQSVLVTIGSSNSNKVSSAIKSGQRCGW